MPLVLAPSYDEQTRQQIEEFISTLQMRRMSAALEYQLGHAAKLERASEKLAKRAVAYYATLLKRIETAEKAADALQDQLQKCEMLRAEINLTNDLSV